MNFTLQVSSRTESLDKNEPAYYVRVQVRTERTEFSELITLRVTKDEFDAMSPGHIFRGDLALLHGAPPR